MTKQEYLTIKEELKRLSAIEKAAVEVVVAFHADDGSDRLYLNELYAKIRELRKTLG